MKKALVLVYGGLCYVIFFAVFLYLIAFINDIVVPKSVSSGIGSATSSSVGTDVVLIMLFGLQHSVMARAGFKRLLTQIVPVAAERSTYVLASSVALVVLFIFWRAMPEPIWSTASDAARLILGGLAGAGWLLVLLSTFLTNHFDLFGLRQVYLEFSRKMYTPVGFREYFYYRWVRHPMMTGLLIALWACPTMSASRLLFCLGMTGYIFVGTVFEEAALRSELGDTYSQYAKRTKRFVPFTF